MPPTPSGARAVLLDFVESLFLSIHPVATKRNITFTLSITYSFQFKTLSLCIKTAMEKNVYFDKSSSVSRGSSYETKHLQLRKVFMHLIEGQKIQNRSYCYISSVVIKYFEIKIR